MTTSNNRAVLDIGDHGRSPKAAERIARSLVNYIVDRDLAEGTMLPVERDLMAQFGVGRNSLREALRLLESRGVITIRSGRSGGPVVRRPRPEDLGESLSLLLQFERGSLNDVMEAWRVIEPTIASLAAERITEDQLVELDQCVARMTANLNDREIFLHEDHRFHELVAEASQSRVLRVFAIALKSLADADPISGDLTPAQRKSLANAHREIIGSLRAGRDAAREAMAVHLDAAAKAWRRHQAKAADQPLRWLEQ